MCLCKIDNIDIVPQAGSVLGWIIISENAQALSLSDCCLGDEWNEVVWHSARKLTDKG